MGGLRKDAVTLGPQEQESIKIEGVRLEWKGPEELNNIVSALVKGIANADLDSAENIKEKFERLFQKEAPLEAHMKEDNVAVVLVGDLELRIVKKEEPGAFLVTFNHIKVPQLSLGTISRFTDGLHVSQNVWRKDENGVLLIKGHRIRNSYQREIPFEKIEEADVFKTLFELIQRTQAQPETAEELLDTLTQQASLAFTTAAKLIASAADGSLLASSAEENEYRSPYVTRKELLEVGSQEIMRGAHIPPTLRVLLSQMSLLDLYKLLRWLEDLKDSSPSSTHQ